jgi:hypothetical protein
LHDHEIFSPILLFVQETESRYFAELRVDHGSPAPWDIIPNVESLGGESWSASASPRMPGGSGKLALGALCTGAWRRLGADHRG